MLYGFFHDASDNLQGRALISSDSADWPRQFECDVAIYGAGPAGISLARALSGSGLQVGLFEGGGLEPPVVSRDHPYQGANTGLEYDMIGTRLRFFGGTSNHWGGWCRPLDAIDFEKRDKVPAPG